jgi:putative ABC transport system permease protein
MPKRSFPPRRLQHFLETSWQDLRFGLRSLRKSSVFTAVAVLTLGLGIGATTSVFSLINAVLIRPLPYPNPGRLAYVWSPNPRFALPLEYLTPMTADFFDLQRENHSFASLALFGSTKFNMASDGRAEALGGTRVTAEFFQVFGIPPELGRILNPTDDLPGRSQVAVISDRFWRDQFGAQPDVLTKTILLDARPFRIIGVMPAGFHFPRSTDVLDAPKVTDIWIPWGMTPQQKANREDSSGSAIGRLREDVSLEQAQADMSGLMSQIDLLRPAKDRGFGAKVAPLDDSATSRHRRPLLFLMGATGLLLLIACGNVAGLVMARASGRLHEMGVRTVLGAGRVRLIRQLLTEAIVLALGGGVVGVAIAFGTIRVVSRIDPGNIPRLQETSIDAPVLFFALAVAMATGMLFSIFPAWFISQRDPSEVLNQSGTRSIKGVRSRFHPGMIVAQISLTVVLLTCSGLLVRSFMKVQSAKKGFDPHSTVTVNIALDARYEQPERQVAFYHDLVDALGGVPGVRVVGAVTNLPLDHGETLSWLQVDGHNFDEKVFFRTMSVTPDYFAAMGISLLEGRDFTDADSTGRPNVAIIGRTFAADYFSGRSPLGQRFHFVDDSPNPTWWTIVGVVDDVRGGSLEEKPQPQAYLSFWQASAASASIVLRTNTRPESVAAAIRTKLSALDRTLAPADIRTMGQLVSESTAARRFQTLLLSAFSATAFVLSLVGLYALLAYSVRQQTAEIGIRMALGAQRTDVMRSVLREGAKLVLGGIAVGSACAWGSTRLITSLLFETTPTDPRTFLAVAGSFFVVAIAACFIPAWRAMRVDPMAAIHYE